ncbi:MAG TPA: FAD:protein FMN transferase [Acidimicrobiia bacterium]|nr:FAD:protein FMN transferase [Acidimicrobiia bacterium]
MADAPTNHRLQASGAAAARRRDHDRDGIELSVEAVPVVTEARFRAMGSDARVVLVDGDPELLDDARAHIELLEARWSRFRVSSELCRLNARPNVPVVVSRDTFAVVARAVDAWQRTAGRFDPTVLPALRAAGYDRGFAVIAHDGPIATAPADPAPSLGCAGIVFDPVVSAITLPAGVVLDLGGIGKGYAADLVAGALVAAGARGACVHFGCDLRVAGEPMSGDAWRVAVDDGLGELRLATGAVATTSRDGRGRALHGRIDPATGTGLHTGLASATVVAADAWWAAALSKAAFLSGIDAGAQLVCDAGATGWFVHDDGRVLELPGMDAFRA